MHIADRLMLLFAPIPWRDTHDRSHFTILKHVQCPVDFIKGMKNTGYLETMLKAIRDDIVKKPRFNTDTLMRLFFDRFIKLSCFVFKRVWESSGVFRVFAD